MHFNWNAGLTDNDDINTLLVGLTKLDAFSYVYHSMQGNAVWVRASGKDFWLNIIITKEATFMVLHAEIDCRKNSYFLGSDREPYEFYGAYNDMQPDVLLFELREKLHKAQDKYN